MNHETDKTASTCSDILLASSRSDDYKIVTSSVGNYENRVFTAYSLDKVISYLEQRVFALLIFDRDFQDACGLETVLSIRSTENAKDIPFVVLADKETERDASDFHALGALDYLVRPIDPYMMKNKIQFFINHFKLKENKVNAGNEQQNRNMAKPPVTDMNRTVADLAGGIAHQFNNTLNIITGHVELLKMDMPENPKVASFSSVIFDSVKKMTALTDKLLAYARAGRNRPGKVELNGFLAGSLGTCSYDKKNITVESSLDPGNILVDADESQLRMVFSALFRNAVEAIDGSGRIQVTTKYIPGGDRRKEGPGKEHGDVVLFEVKDTGVGMSKEISSRIFEPFFSTKFQGRGLDMAAVQGIVTSHGGWIDVHSYPNEGTIVSVYLPVSSYRKASVFRLAENFIKETGTVLVIDDDKSIRDLTVTMLNRLGYQAIAASTGWEAIEVADRLKKSIDLAMLDIEMPDMKGDELYPHLMRVCPGLKVIVCSGYSMESHGKRFLNNGAQMFMQKPFSFGDLALNMRKLIERRREKRYHVNDGRVFIPAFPKPLETALIDISLKGASVITPAKDVTLLEEWGKLSIHSGNDDFNISDIPFQFLPNTLSFFEKQLPTKSIDRLHLRFGDLTDEKLSQIGNFISQCTAGL